MRKLLALSLVLIGACASSSTGTKTAATASDSSNSHAKHHTGELRPQVDIVQTSGLAVAARYMDGAFSVRYALRVVNPSPAEITLRRVTVSSVTGGAYNVAPFSMPFEVAVASTQQQDVQFWAPAETSPYSVVGANGPVTLRVICEFDSAVDGRFQQVITRVVNSRASVTGQYGPSS
jgi:hypothetical protein